MRRIPETDLARIAVMPPDQQPAHLQLLKEFRPPHTLNPFRAALPDIVNLQHEMFGTTDQTSWSVIEDRIRKSKEGEDGIEKNLGVAKALYNYCRTAEMRSFEKVTPKWSVGYGHSVAFWNAFYSVWQDEAAFLHFDPRITHPLSPDGRRFALSLMHQRLRVDDPDFAEVELCVVSFGREKSGNRFLKLHKASEVELFSYDQLTSMIDFTYRLWVAELARRDEAAKRAGAGSNPMGF